MMTGFFLLSGFSLYYVYQTKDLQNVKSLGQFYRKRLAGILPSYYAAGLVYCIFRGTESMTVNLVLAPMELLCLQSVYPSTFGLTHNGGTWFISCIVLCYGLFPFVKGCVNQLSTKEKCKSLLTVIGILLYSPIAVWYLGLPTIYSNPFIRGLEFAAGILLASLMTELKAHPSWNKLLTNKGVLLMEAVLVILSVSWLYSRGIARGNYLMYSFAVLPLFCLMLIGLAGTPWKKLHTSRLLSYASEISYAFFLVQLFLWDIVRKWIAIVGMDNNWFRILSSFIICTGIAIAIHELIEKPSKKILTK